MIQKLDGLVALLKAIPDGVDDLANAFYELNADEATTILHKVCQDARNAATMVAKSWKDEEDEYTAWAGKWNFAMEPKSKQKAGETS
jgi:hypothetical protein